MTQTSFKSLEVSEITEDNHQQMKAFLGNTRTVGGTFLSPACHFSFDNHTNDVVLFFYFVQ